MESRGMDEEWLRSATRNGFDVHHRDGNHSNNDPDNLIMIFSKDHAYLHSTSKFSARVNGKWMTQEEIDDIKLTKGERAYRMRLEGKVWREIGGGTLPNCAKFYAKKHGLKWPIHVPHPRETVDTSEGGLACKVYAMRLDGYGYVLIAQKFKMASKADAQRHGRKFAEANNLSWPPKSPFGVIIPIIHKSPYENSLFSDAMKRD